MEFNPNYRRSLLMTTAAPLCWSLSGLGVRMVNANPWVIIFWRSLFMTLTILCFVVIRDRTRTLRTFKKMGMSGLAAGASLAMAMTCYVNSLSYTTVANALVLQGTAPLFAALFGWFLLRERIKVGTWLAIIVVFTCMIVMVSESLVIGKLLGDGLALGNAIAVACYIIVIRAAREIDLIPSLCFAGFLSALIAIPMMTTFLVTNYEFGILIILGTIQIGLGMILFIAGSRNLPPAQTSLLTLLETVLGPIWVWLFIQEQPTVLALISGALIVITLALHTIFESRFSRNIHSTNRVHSEPR